MYIYLDPISHVINGQKSHINVVLMDNKNKTLNGFILEISVWIQKPQPQPHRPTEPIRWRYHHYDNQTTDTTMWHKSYLMRMTDLTLRVHRYEINM